MFESGDLLTVRLDSFDAKILNALCSFAKEFDVLKSYSIESDSDVLHFVFSMAGVLMIVAGYPFDDYDL